MWCSCFVFLSIQLTNINHLVCSPGKRVAIIVDSGPGRVNADMLARLRIRGFYLIPGVPNTTHVTQPTDKNYGVFKSVYRENLRKLTVHRSKDKKAIKPTDIPLLIFGGDPLEIGLKSAFEEAFVFEKNIKIWGDIGLYPFTRKCLEDNNVKHEIVTLEDGTIDVDADPLAVKLLEIEDLNSRSTSFLDLNGLKGSILKISAPRLDKSKTMIGVTAPQSRARQDLLAKASTAGSRFYATGGEMLNSDDFFIAHERKERSEEAQRMKDRKKECTALNVHESEAKTVIEKLRVTKNKDAYTDEGAKALDVSGLKVLYKWKYGKGPKSGMNKIHLLAAWNAAKTLTDDESKIWTAEDEVELHRLDNEVIKMSDTEVGRQTGKVLDDAIAVLSICSHDQLKQLKTAIQSAPVQEASPTPDTLKYEVTEI